jgi:hypothetical protein
MGVFLFWCNVANVINLHQKVTFTNHGWVSLSNHTNFLLWSNDTLKGTIDFYLFTKTRHRSKLCYNWVTFNTLKECFCRLSLRFNVWHKILGTLINWYRYIYRHQVNISTNILIQLNIHGTGKTDIIEIFQIQSITNIKNTNIRLGRYTREGSFLTRRSR